MGTQLEKVFVALGNDLQDGFKTLGWTLKKWKSHPISIVILHVTYNISNSKDFVYTPFGKLPASSVSDEKLEVLKTYEQEKIDKLLSKYIAFCGKIKAEILKVEKSDEPLHKSIVDLISRYRITKLVMGMTFMKSSSWRSKSAISGSFYIHEHKPDFCELFIVCGGKLVFLKGEYEEAFIEDDKGVMVARKANLKHWLGKMFAEHSRVEKNPASSNDLASSNSDKQWENYVEEIENYFAYLLSLNLDEGICEEENSGLQAGLVEPDDSTTLSNVPRQSCAARIDSMRKKLDEAQKLIQLNREETKANAERCSKAEWAIHLSTARVEELESKIQEEIIKRTETSKNVDILKEQIQELHSDVQESQNRLDSLMELQSELSTKLQTSGLARSYVEAQLQKAVVARAEMVREIEELRRQRDVLRRRIEFCREKDAIGMATKMNEVTCSHREYKAEDIRVATDGFSENLRLKSGGDWTNVYRGRMDCSTVAIKMLNSDDSRLCDEDFLAKVKLLSKIRHPHLVAIMGHCSELKCIIFEYMHYGSLRDMLSSSTSKRNRGLRWHDRIRVAHEVCSGLSFLHSTKPWPIAHGNLSTSTVLLDRNLVAKISGLGLSRFGEEHDVRPDIRAFGLLLLHLLTGRNWAGLVEEAMATDRTALVRVLDEVAGRWPLDLAEELVGVAMKCVSIFSCGPSADVSLANVREKLGEIRRKANDIVAKGGGDEVTVDTGGDREVPGIFLCPIFQDVMKDPHVAADGHSYELEAIKEWLNMGRDTSPMTNLRLNHKFLTPNHNLRSLIQDWHKQHKSAVAS
ncbi:hypothetical protein Tsubulata_002674 [Turnera subulata]|uniref:RING-type E3 ubiquitin transferase n=1 Tax=Turnera subulata TaxID=218843 RepID=A0A9Q0F5L7_9ROSI|nr:hypothetical protein Tsubulata_002674 [Turnera subulata]